MNKTQLIEVVARESALSRKQATDAVESLLRTMTLCLQSGEKVQLVRFGRFSVTHRVARKTKIPGTNRIVEIPEHKTVKFTAGKALKAALNVALD